MDSNIEFITSVARITPKMVSKRHNDLLRLYESYTCEYDFIDEMLDFGYTFTPPGVLSKIRGMFFLDEHEPPIYECINMSLNGSVINSHYLQSEQHEHNLCRVLALYVQDVVMIENLRKSLLEYYTWDYDGPKLNQTVLDTMQVSEEIMSRQYLDFIGEILTPVFLKLQLHGELTWKSFFNAVKSFEPFIKKCQDILIAYGYFKYSSFWSIEDYCGLIWTFHMDF